MLEQGLEAGTRRGDQLNSASEYRWCMVDGSAPSQCQSGVAVSLESLRSSVRRPIFLDNQLGPFGKKTAQLSPSQIDRCDKKLEVAAKTLVTRLPLLKLLRRRREMRRQRCVIK